MEVEVKIEIKVKADRDIGMKMKKTKSGKKIKERVFNLLTCQGVTSGGVSWSQLDAHSNRTGTQLSRWYV